MLPSEVLQILDTVELLQSMWPDEVSILPSYASALDQLQGARPKLEADQHASNLPDELRLNMCIALEDAKALQLELCFPLSRTLQGDQVLLKPSSFLSRKQYELLQAEVTRPEDDDAFVDSLLESVERLRTRGSELLLKEASEAALSKTKGSGPELESDDVGLDRVWYWL